MKVTDFLTTEDLGVEVLAEIFSLAVRMKREPQAFEGALAHRFLALVFEKPSLRTRTTFEVAARRLSGHTIYLSPAEIGLGKRESVADVARNLERWVHFIVARTFSHLTLEELARWASIPVVNALSDRFHPCQALADAFTLVEAFGDLEGKRLCFVGDGNNVAQSLLLIGPKALLDVTVVTPPGYEPDRAVVSEVERLAEAAGTKVLVTNDLAAVEGADAVYTDVWASMGQEDEAEERARVFRPYQVNAALMARAKPGALFLHCLPAHRGDEVTDEVANSPASVIFDQAENRLWAQMALLFLIGRNLPAG